MELKLGADNRYHLYSPPKNTALDAGRKKAKPRSLEQLVEEINGRFSAQNADQTKLGVSTIKTGLRQLEKEQEREDAPSLEELFEASQAKIRKNGFDNFGSQANMTYKMLSSLKGCADTIAKYEKLAANEFISEEERTFYQEALESLHKNFDKAFEDEVGRIAEMTGDDKRPRQILESVGIQSFRGMNSTQILEKIDAAQKRLQGFVAKSPLAIEDLSFEASLSMFEANSTLHLKNADKYGCMPTSWEDCINNPRWRVLKQDFIGNIHLGEKGFWLDTTA